MGCAKSISAVWQETLMRGCPSRNIEAFLELIPMLIWLYGQMTVPIKCVRRSVVIFRTGPDMEHPRQIELIKLQEMQIRGLEWGSKQDSLCVLLHGLGDAACVWQDFGSRIADRYRAVAIDLPGHGESDWHTTGAYTTDILVQALAASIELLGPKELILVGHSLGGELAIHLATHYPDRTAALVMVDCGPELGLEAVEHFRSAFLTSPSHFPTLSAYLDWLVETRPLSDPVLVEKLALYSSRITESAGCELRLDPALRHFPFEGINHSDRYFDSALHATLETVDCPTLVVRGRASSILPRDAADRIIAQRPGKRRLSIVPRAGHAVMTDNPAGFADVVISFLHELPQISAFKQAEAANV
jgi:pimeloyl-ACP methyl ester carboxylesterase